MTVDWGDGGGVETLTDVDQTNDEFSGMHTYTDGGIFTITVTVADEDGGVSISQETTAVVTGVGVQDNVLYVIGTSSADHVTINKQGNNKLKVHADFLTTGNFVTIDTQATPVDKIIASNVALPNGRWVTYEFGRL